MAFFDRPFKVGPVFQPPYKIELKRKSNVATQVKINQIPSRLPSKPVVDGCWSTHFVIAEIVADRVGWAIPSVRFCDASVWQLIKYTNRVVHLKVFFIKRCGIRNFTILSRCHSLQFRNLGNWIIYFDICIEKYVIDIGFRSMGKKKDTWSAMCF